MVMSALKLILTVGLLGLCLAALSWHEQAAGRPAGGARPQEAEGLLGYCRKRRVGQHRSRAPTPTARWTGLDALLSWDEGWLVSPLLPSLPSDPLPACQPPAVRPYSPSLLGFLWRAKGKGVGN